MQLQTSATLVSTARVADAAEAANNDATLLTCAFTSPLSSTTTSANSSFLAMSTSFQYTNSGLKSS